MAQETKNKIKKLALGALTVLLAVITLAPLAAAAGAKLFLSPSSGTYYVGSSIAVDVLVNTGGNPTNAYRAVLNFPEDKLEAVAISSGGSICSLWIPPTPNYTNISATFECGATQAFKGKAGRIGTITFTAKAAGDATVSISDGEVKKADGIGTELLSARGSALLKIEESPAGVPVISSSTHPDQNGWYQSRAVELAWTTPAGADGFSYILNRKADDVPDNTAEGTAADKTYADLEDGIWYFHLKAHNPEGWGATGRFRFQIDNRPPEDFEIVVDPPSKQIARAPLLSFAAIDRLSGIDRYEISIDGADPITTASPYQFERIKGGVHEILVRAFDRAGNTKDAQATLMVVGVSPPKITRPAEGESIPFLAPLNVAAAANSAGTIELLLDGRVAATLDTDAGFKIEHALRRMILPGEHKLGAVFVNADGIESEPSEIRFRVDPGSVYLLGLVVPGIIFYPVFLVLTGILIAFLVMRVKRWKKGRKKKSSPAPSPADTPENGSEGEESEEKKEKEKEVDR